MAYKNGAGTPTTDGEQAAISLAPSLGKRDAGYFQATSDPDRKVAFVVDEELAVSPSSNSQADGDKQGDEKKRNGYGEAGEGHAGNADHLPNGLMPHENVRRGLEQRHLQVRRSFCL